MNKINRNSVTVEVLPLPSRAAPGVLLSVVASVLTLALVVSQIVPLVTSA